MIDVQAIRAKNPLRETVEKLAGVKFKGSSHGWQQCKCPLHPDGDSPSFSIKGDGEMYHCYGCPPETYHGDVIQFVMHYKKMTFQEACEFLGGGADISPAELLQAHRQRKDELDELERKERGELNKQREAFNASMEWMKACEARRTAPSAQEWWEKRGVPKDWQDYWQLGYIEDLWGHGHAAAIPYFEVGGKAVTMQYRYWTPNGDGKYRFQPGLGTAAWIARTDSKLGKSKQILAVEGPIKAQVSYIRGVETAIQVIGYPSENNLGDGAAELLKAAASIIWWPDPGEPSFEWCMKHIRNLGVQRTSKVVRSIYKPDDAILLGLSPDEFAGILRQARPVSRRLR